MIHPSAETADERERDAAASNDVALVAYEEKWNRRYRRLQAAHPERWRVPGWSEAEVRDALTLRLIELVRSSPDERAAFNRPGEEWGLSVAKARLAELRRSFRIRSTPMDLRDPPLSRRTESDEERFIAREEEVGLHRAGARAEAALSRPQRQWLAAMRDAAERGEFFATSDRLNLSAASRILGKNRSSAARAYAELSERFRRERSRSE